MGNDMKITRTETTPVQPRLQPDTPPQPAPAKARAPAAADTGISQEAQSLTLARRELAGAADVDLAKVEQIRSAIAEGRMPLDLDALAKAVVEMHRP